MNFLYSLYKHGAANTIAEMIRICKADGNAYTLKDARKANKRDGFTQPVCDVPDHDIKLTRRTLSDRELKKAYALGAQKAKDMPDY